MVCVNCTDLQDKFGKWHYQYEFLMVSDFKHLTDTNLFDKACCYVLEEDWPDKKSFINLALKFIVDSKDIKNFDKFEKYVFKKRQSNYHFVDSELSNINDLRESLEAKGKTITIKFAGKETNPEIIWVGNKYLSTFSKVKNNENKIEPIKNKMEQNAINNIQKEIQSFLNKQKNTAKTIVDTNLKVNQDR